MNPNSLVNSQQNLISSLLITSEELQNSNHKLSKAHFADSLYLEELQAKNKSIMNEVASNEEGSHMKERRILIQSEENLIFSTNINLLLHKMEKLIVKEQWSTEKINEETGRRLDMEKENKILMMRVNHLNLEKENIVGNLERERAVFSEREQLLKSQIQKLHSHINLLNEENTSLRNEKESLKKENSSLNTQVTSLTHSLHSTNSLLHSTQQSLSSQTLSYTQLSSTSQAALQRMEANLQHLLSSERATSLSKQSISEELSRTEEKVVCLSRKNQELEVRLHKAEEEEWRRRREEEELALLLEKIEIPKDFEGSNEINSLIRTKRGGSESKHVGVQGDDRRNGGLERFECKRTTSELKKDDYRAEEVDIKPNDAGLNINDIRIKAGVAESPSSTDSLREFLLILRSEYVRARRRALNAEQVLESLTESLDEKLRVLREKHEEWKELSEAYNRLREEERIRVEEEGRKRVEESKRKVQFAELQRSNSEIKEQSKYLLKNLKGVFEENKRLRAALVIYDSDMAYGKWREGVRVDGRREEDRRNDGRREDEDREDGGGRMENGGKKEDGGWDIEEILEENWKLRKMMKKFGEMEGRDL